MKPQLILVDGLPGSGKTTLAQELSAHLANNNQVTVYYETTRNHPLHVVPTDDFGAAWPDIHLRVSPQDFAERSLERWATFLNILDTGDRVVLESFPFQSTIRVLLQMGADEKLIESHWHAWKDLQRPIGSHFIYLKTLDPAFQITQIAEQRGQYWQEYISNAVEQMPFAKSRGLSSWSAVEEFMTTYGQLTDRLAEQYNLPIAILEAQPADYRRRFEQALSAIQVEPVRGETGPLPQ